MSPQRVGQQSKIRAFPIAVRRSTQRMQFLAIQLRIHVRRTARQNDRVQRVRQFIELGLRQPERNFYRDSAGRFDRLQIPVVFLALAAKFFFYNSIRDTHARTAARPRSRIDLPISAHTAPSYPNHNRNWNNREPARGPAANAEWKPASRSER